MNWIINMKNDIRGIIVLFLAMIKNKYEDDIIIYQFLQDINDIKLNEMYDNYCDLENTIKNYIKNIN